jgi:peptidoglycan/LPS O-acetylase OafA/YrhL
MVWREDGSATLLHIKVHSREQGQLDAPPSTEQMRANSSKSYVHLDLLRGLAALAVFFEHLRSFVFTPYATISSHGPLNSLVWFASGFGHQAVMVFFVLSGFFITKSVIEDDNANRFSWQLYLIKRLSRLWIVLIPCLFLTLIWDQIGRHYSTNGFYEGSLYSLYNSMAPGDESLGIGTFLGNIAFLQTIKVPVFGSDGPLWSLANEWWYYIIFLFGFMMVRTPSNRLARLATLLVGLLLTCLLVGKYLLILGGVWLFGTVCFFLHDRSDLKKFLQLRLALLLSLASLFLALLFSKTSYGSNIARDYAVGLAAAFVVLTLAARSGSGATLLYKRFAHTIAESSYTLYLTHFPFLAAVVNVILLNHKFQPTLGGYSVMLLLGAVTLIYCYGVYWLFERHTATVRRYCIHKFIGRSVVSKVPSPAAKSTADKC